MTLETANKGAMVAAVSSPWWLPLLQNVSEFSAMVLPVAGLCWIVIQASIALYKFKKGK